MPSLLEQAQVRPQKDPKFGPLFIEKAFTGYYPNRSPLHDPSDIVTARFYGGRPDALWDGLNVELTNQLTLARRPGTSLFSSATYPTPPLITFGFENNASGSDTITLLVDTAAAVYIDNQNGTKTLLFNKTTGAGQTGFVSIGNVCYMGDGVDFLKYTPGNPNGLIWNWGIATPTNAPTLTVTSEATAAVAWKASTVYSTLGIVIDSNGNAQQLIAVNLPVNGVANTTQYGETGQGQPPWNQSSGGTTTETSGTPIVWKNLGQIEQWLPNTFYGNQAPIYDPVTNCVFTNFHSAGSTSGTTKPNFNAAIGSFTSEHNGPIWGNLGLVGSSAMTLWLPATAYHQFDNGPNPMLVVEPIIPNANNTVHGSAKEVSIWLQSATNSGTSGTNYAPPWATTSGLTTQDGNNVWMCLGTATWSSGMTAVAWAQGVSVFTVVKDGASNLWVCTVGGTAAAGFTFPSSPNYGDVTKDANNVQWTCIGPAGPAWAINQTWYLPPSGFSPPSSTQPYGSAAVVDSNNNVQFVTTSGTSGSSAPSWSTIKNSLNATTDNTAKWTMSGAYNQFFIQWSTSLTYAFSYKCRNTTDDYNTTGLLTFENLNTAAALSAAGITAPGLALALGTASSPYQGGGTGAVSSASPVSALNGADTGAVVTITGQYSPDPQVDTIVLWRSADGGGSSNMFELVEIPNYPSLAGQINPATNQPYQWQFQDFLPSVPTTTAGINFPGLDILNPAPINGVNDPPVAGFIPHAYHFQRIWGPSGTDVYFSGGPDTLVGNPNEAFYESDYFPFLSTPQRCLHTPQGLIVFTRADIEIIAGGPSTASFYQTTLAPGVGLGNFNAIDIYAGEIYFFSSDASLMTLSPSLQVAWTGFAVANVLATWNPDNVYVTVHHNGTDRAIFVADGSTQWLRLNPHQAPGLQPGLASEVWSLPGKIAAGVGMVQSVQTSPGVFELLIGATTDNQSILKRDLTVWADAGTAYEAYFTMGSLVLVHPGETAYVPFIESDFAQIGIQPTVSILQNEISGSFTTLTNFVYDPPIVYQSTLSPASYWPLRFYLVPSIAPMRMRHCQIKVDYGDMDTVMNECFNLTIYGQRVVEA